MPRKAFRRSNWRPIGHVSAIEAWQMLKFRVRMLFERSSISYANSADSVGEVDGGAERRVGLPGIKRIVIIKRQPGFVH
jgi:hypothetical protein